jgi:hypothetical protein
MDPFARAASNTYLNSPRRCQELYFENGQKESPLDIRMDTIELHDNVKYFRRISRHKHLL